MLSHLFAAALAALVAAGAFAAARPVAQWDVIPYQRISEPFKAGVVAFYDKPFHVDFFVNGKKVASSDKKSLNDRTKTEEHWFVLDPSGFDAGSLKDRVLKLGAKAVADDGASYRIPDIVLYWDGDGKTGSKKVVWVDPKDGIDFSVGTKEKPVKTLRQAVKIAGDGGTIRLLRAGMYTAERVGGGNGRKYWTTIMPGDGLKRKDIHIKGGRTGCDKLHFKDVMIFSDITSGVSYALGGVDENSVCWLEGCLVRDKGGRSAGRSYTFGNKMTGYVTGGVTMEMGDGPRGKIVRGHLIKNISGDAFTGEDCLAINCKLDDVDCTGVMDEPAFHRSQGIQGAWTHDVILANITASQCGCNGFIGLKLRDSAFSNITLDTIGPEHRFVSRYAWEMENVWFDRVNVTGQEWVWFKATNHNGNYTPIDVRVTDCSFQLPKPPQD